MFQGIRFCEPGIYRTDEAKNLLTNLCDVLQHRSDLCQFGVDPNEPRRSRLTGKDQEHVWDFLPLRGDHPKQDAGQRPHLSVDLGFDGAWAFFTVPNSSRRQLTLTLQELELDGYSEIVKRCAAKLDPTVRRSQGATPVVRVLQRHYIGRTTPVMDGQLIADLRTQNYLDSGGFEHPSIKSNGEWIRASYHLMLAPEANLQFSIGVGFSYRCEILKSPEATDLFVEVWLGLSELISLLLPPGRLPSGNDA
jgi:hypothetical protein